MRRDWTAIAAGLGLAAVAVALLLLSLPDSLPSCESVTGNIDGGGGTPCGSGFDWDGQSIVGTVVASFLGVLAVVGVALGLRRRAR
jgi:hypothetical protein